MKQQLIDRNECIAQINTLIEALAQQFTLSGGTDLHLECAIVNAQYIRSEIIAKMPIVEEREL